MAISIAFFGLGIGAFTVYAFRTRIKISENKNDNDNSPIPSKIVLFTVTFAISIPVFLIVVGYVIPPNTTFIYLFYIASSIPFFFAGMALASIYVAMPKEISKLYFMDLTGAAVATLVLDPLMQKLGAESTLLLLALVISVFSIVPTLFLTQYAYKESKVRQTGLVSLGRKTKSYAIAVVALTAFLTVVNTFGYNSSLMIEPGENKILHYRLADPSFQQLGTLWNSFSRIDVTQQTTSQDDSDISRKKVLASILIDADADTPIYRWNGSVTDLQWVKQFMDFLPYEMSADRRINDTLVIGSGGGGDVLVALAGNSKNVTAVELNPSIATTVKQFGKAAGNLYERNDVKLIIDDGRRFVASSNSKYDIIVIKLVDSWAAQLAGGYALSENYLYTVEAFRQYLQHLEEENGMLVMVRWNIELPRLLPLVIESLIDEEEGKSIEDISKQIVVVEDRPGLYFGSNEERTIYPVLVMIKNSPFTDDEISAVNNQVTKNDARVIAIPGQYVQPPYDRLLSTKNYQDNGSSEANPLNSIHPFGTPNWQQSNLGLKIPTDDSPFYFAKEQVPKQMITLLETVLILSSVLAGILIYYSRTNKIQFGGPIRFYILFVIFIGLGFIFLEITFIQKFLLLLGTPILALTVILFSILLSTGIGSYLSGSLFDKKPQKAIAISIPILIGLVLINYNFLQEFIVSNIGRDIYLRIALTVGLLSPIGLTMGFQFPSIVRLAYSFLGAEDGRSHQGINHENKFVTLIWGVNVIASVVGTVLAAIGSMTIGFGANLLIAAAFYLAALLSTIMVGIENKKVSRIQGNISQ